MAEAINVATTKADKEQVVKLGQTAPYLRKYLIRQSQNEHHKSCYLPSLHGSR